MKELDKITPRAVDFATWYTNVVQEAKLIQYTDVKGMMIFQPYGWAIWENIRQLLDPRFKQLGVQNVAMPLLIPFADLAKEKEHLEGFSPEIFLVKSVGAKELTEPLAIRPTSEILFCKYFRSVINSYKDLPIKVNQWTSVLRAEKSVKPFLRNSEFFWHETHAIFATPAEADEFTKQYLNLYVDFVEHDLCIPVVSGEKTVGERFAGADHTFTVETMMQDGQALQSATSHNLGQNFVNAYDIQYQDQNNQWSKPYSTSHGLSTRIIGAIIMVHGDDHGLVLPSKIAPIQIKILPILANKFPSVTAVSQQLQAVLTNDYRVEIDHDNVGVGAKLARVEVQGIPVAIVVGPKDLEAKLVTLYRRDTQEKWTVPVDQVMATIPELLKNYDQNLYNKAKNHLDHAIVDCHNLEELNQILVNKQWARVYFGGTPAEEKQIKELTGATPRCIVGMAKEEHPDFFNHQPTRQIVIFARAY